MIVNASRARIVGYCASLKMGLIRSFGPAFAWSIVLALFISYLLATTTSITSLLTPPSLLTNLICPPHLLNTSFTTNSSIMGSLTSSKTDTFLDAVKDRRSIYALDSSSPISDAKIEEIVKHAVKWAPSTYNVQSARAVVLFKDNHAKFWDIVKEHMGKIPLEGGMRAYMDGRIAGWRASYGTVLWFEDQVALDALAEKNPVSCSFSSNFASQRLQDDASNSLPLLSSFLDLYF